MTDVRAVFFDLDGTLIDSIPAHARAWKQILGEIGITLSELYIELHEGEKAEETISRLARDNNRDVSNGVLEALIAKKRALYRTMAPQGLNPQARRMIEELIRRGIECDIVTGSARSNIDGVLPQDEIDLFTHIVSADDYALGKPDPAPYLTAIAHSGFAPELCVVLENAPLGIHSGKAAGLFTVAITTTLPPRYLEAADRIIDTYDEFLMTVLSAGGSEHGPTDRERRHH